MINSIIETRTKNVTHAHKKDAFCAVQWVEDVGGTAVIRCICEADNPKDTHTQTCTHTHVNSQERQPQQVQVNSQIKDMLLSLLLLFVLASPGTSSQSVGGFDPAFNLICKLLCVYQSVVNDYMTTYQYLIYKTIPIYPLVHLWTNLPSYKGYGRWWFLQGILVGSVELICFYSNALCKTRRAINLKWEDDYYYKRLIIIKAASLTSFDNGSSGSSWPVV